MYRLKFSDNPDIELIASSMAEAITNAGDTLIACEDFDEFTGEVYGSISQINDDDCPYPKPGSTSIYDTEDQPGRFIHSVRIDQ